MADELWVYKTVLDKWYLLDTMSASISLTLTVTDIEDPFKRSATYSKTITLVGTERNMLALGLSNDLQSYYQDFDVGRNTLS